MDLESAQEDITNAQSVQRRTSEVAPSIRKPTAPDRKVLNVTSGIDFKGFKVQSGFRDPAIFLNKGVSEYFSQTAVSLRPFLALQQSVLPILDNPAMDFAKTAITQSNKYNSLSSSLIRKVADQARSIDSSPFFKILKQSKSFESLALPNKRLELICKQSFPITKLNGDRFDAIKHLSPFFVHNFADTNFLGNLISKIRHTDVFSAANLSSKLLGQITLPNAYTADVLQIYATTTDALPTKLNEFFSLANIVRASLESLDEQISHTEETFGMGVLGAPAEVQKSLIQVKHRLRRCKSVFERTMQVPPQAFADELRSGEILRLLFKVHRFCNWIIWNLDQIWNFK